MGPKHILEDSAAVGGGEAEVERLKRREREG
jgi:hypothetical protein